MQAGAAAFLAKKATFESIYKVVLASGSPRRRELLQILGVKFDVVTSGFPEDLDKSKFKASEYVVANAKEKCLAVARNIKDAGTDASEGKRVLIVGADTVIGLDEKILEKPGDAEEACAMLRSLSGRNHIVYTGLAVAIAGQPSSLKTHTEATEVHFHELSDADIAAYVATGEPFDKAGGYGIQSLGNLLVKKIHGDYFNVVGLPLSALSSIFAQFAEVPAQSSPAFIDKLAWIVLRDRKHLVARSYGKDAFFTPGGKREPGESDHEALIREVEEECGVKLDPASIKPYDVFQAQAYGKPEGTMVRLTCYTASFSGELTPSQEIEELQWISSQNPPKLTVTGYMVLEDLKNKGLID
eukprot:TRINITY_DN101312_c0_g1_i1.p1 TRINITY_DN101312_c0_g1~~TRINITY_DN101312_c0_g1_i1.p1  ORF type:complete len:372 (+),score=50.33 TRINITY_DN101312_c0_g1_i1:49-1116(+)